MSNLLKISVCLLVLSTAAPLKAITPVDVELQLLLDISGSIDSNEYDLQLQGYQGAFQSDTVQNAIINGTLGQIAVQMIMWSSSSQQQVMVDWTLIDSAQAANDFANDLASLARPFAGWTAIGSAIEYSYPLFDSNGFDGTAQVIDISGDGTNNQGISPDTAANNAINAGVDTINGIVITTSQSVIDQYADDVIAGDSPFLLAPADFAAFQTSVENKIAAEIAGTTPVGAIAIPEPSSLTLLFIALISLGLMKHLVLGKKLITKTASA